MIRIFMAFIMLIMTPFVFGQDISIGMRDSILSEVLKEERPFSIYLPPSYHENSHKTFPVLYILDGDYNFHYVTGLVELQSNIAENIPEMIVIGISGKGSSTYRKNSKPDIEGIEDSGNADEFMKFLKTELIPLIDRKYKSNSYRILGGHSIGGLSVIYTALKNPKLFDHFIAISPALWWEDNAIYEVGKEIFQNEPRLGTDVYVSLANEKRMGVRQFLTVTDSDFKFRQFENENHNSVGAPTYKWALTEIFEAWKIKKLYFETGKELEEYYGKMKSQYNQVFLLPKGVLNRTATYELKDNASELLILQRVIKDLFPASYPYFNTLLATNLIEEKKFHEAEELLKETLIDYQDSFEVYQKLAEIEHARGDYSKAEKLIGRSIELGKEQVIRQWQKYELEDLKEQIKKDKI